MIVTGSENASPLENENVITEIHKMLAAVVTLPDDRWRKRL
jgi:acyl-CoA synthetase (AMP-forming)/AMP-acid ligase II